MATPTNPLAIPSTINTAVLNTSVADYQSKLVDNAYNANVIMRYSREMGFKDLRNGGVSIVENLIESQQDAGGFYLGTSTLDTTQPNTLALVEYRWQNAYEPIQISRDEERQNSGDEHKILNLLGTKTILSEKAIAKRLEQALSTSVSGANNLIDLSTLVNTGTLGSIDGSSDTFWQSTSTTSGTFATQGLTDMTTLYYDISSSGQVDNPNLILTTQSVFESFENTRTPLARIDHAAPSANAGFRGLTFKGATVDYGNHIDSGTLYMLNTNYVSLVVDTMTDMVTTPFISPANQTVKVAYILWRGNLTTNNRRRLGKLTSIT